MITYHIIVTIIYPQSLLRAHAPATNYWDLRATLSSTPLYASEL